MPSKFIKPATRTERAQPQASATGSALMRLWFWIVVLAAALTTLLNWMFG